MCLVLVAVELLRHTVRWEWHDLHVHLPGDMIQVGDDHGLVRVAITEAVRSDPILDMS